VSATRRRVAAVTISVAFLAAALQGQEVPNVRGVVTTSFGTPLEGVEVRVEGGPRITHTDERGRFVFASVPKGVQTLTFRRIGFLPAVLGVRVPETSDTLTIAMVAVSHMLDTVQVMARVNVLAGVVLDARNQPLPDARVDLSGTRTAETTTDETGSFTFTSVKSGVVVVRARKPGYEMATHSMLLEDWRGLVLRLDTLPPRLRAAREAELSGIGNTVEYVWKETQHRIGMHGGRATVITREDLAPFSDLTLGEALRYAPAAAHLANDLYAAGGNVCVVKDGHFLVGSTTLDQYGADDVDFVELYPPGTEASGTLAQYVRGGGCRSVRLPGQVRSRGPFYAVIWMR
jgi:hypothetical protein